MLNVTDSDVLQTSLTEPCGLCSQQLMQKQDSAVQELQRLCGEILYVHTDIMINTHSKGKCQYHHHHHHHHQHCCALTAKTIN